MATSRAAASGAAGAAGAFPVSAENIILAGAYEIERINKILPEMLKDFSVRYYSVTLVSFKMEGSDEDLSLVYVCFTPFHHDVMGIILEPFMQNKVELRMSQQRYVEASVKGDLLKALCYGKEEVATGSMVFKACPKEMKDTLGKVGVHWLEKEDMGEIYTNTHVSLMMLNLLRSVHGNANLKASRINNVYSLIDCGEQFAEMERKKSEWEAILRDAQEVMEKGKSLKKEKDNLVKLNERLLEDKKKTQEKVNDLEATLGKEREKVKDLENTVKELRMKALDLVLLEQTNEDLRKQLAMADKKKRQELASNDDYHARVLARIESEHQVALREMMENHKREMRRIQDGHLEQLEAAKVAYQRDITAERSRGEARVIEVENRHEREMFHVQAELASARAHRPEPNEEEVALLVANEEEVALLVDEMVISASLDPCADAVTKLAYEHGYHEGMMDGMKQCVFNTTYLSETVHNLETMVQNLEGVIGNPSAPLFDLVLSEQCASRLVSEPRASRLVSEPCASRLVSEPCASRLVSEPRVAAAAGGVDCSDESLDFDELVLGLLGGAGAAGRT